MNNELMKKNYMEQHDLSVIEQVVMQGDLAKLDPAQRVLYYNKVCDSLGLNPFTRPFDYISLNGKLTLYAKKDATEQLRKLNGISIEKIESKVVDDLYIVKATARTKDGRTDEATGAVVFGHLKGDAKANAIMKAETKAKRRVTLSISGMGWCDESEIDAIPGAKTINVDVATGEIKPLQIEEKPLYKQPAYEHTVVLCAEDKPKEEKKRVLIDAEQIKCLEFFIDGDEEYKKSIFDRLSQYGVHTLADIPKNTYDKVLADAKKNFERREEEAMLKQAVDE